MCFFNQDKQKDPPPIQSPARSVDPQIQAARQDAIRRSRAATGSRSTILTNETSKGGKRRKLAGKDKNSSTILTTGEGSDFILGSGNAY